jgi:hypothetical protein
MAIADESRKRWRAPVLLFTGAFIGAVIFAAVHNRSIDQPHAAATRTAETSAPHPENRMTAPAEGAANVRSRLSPVLQKPGPPDPDAERSAAESAERAADAAAALAASAGGTSN